MRVLLMLLIFLPEVAFTQFQVRQWVFGAHAGMDFINGTAASFNQYPLVAAKGSTVMSNCSGDLLFYSNGKDVFNAQHQHLINLNGNSFNPVISIPVPEQPDRYYLFYMTDTATGCRLFFSIIDMSLNGGTVILRNQMLAQNLCSKLAGVHQENKKDFWLVTHNFNSDEFFSYSITSTGINFTPVVSSAGPVISGATNFDGALEFSIDGRSLVNVVPDGHIGIYNFNRQTGQVQLNMDLSSLAISHPDGASLSPGKKMLYINSPSNYTLYQVDLTLPSLNEIIQSKILMDSISSGLWGEMQIASDGNIYIAIAISTMLAEIKHPDKRFPLCGYNRYATFLNGNSSNLGLPNFVQTFFDVPTELSISELCYDTINTAQLSPVADSAVVTWMADSGVTILNRGAMHCTFSCSHFGDYTLHALVHYPCGTDTLSATIHALEKPVVDLGNDTALCEGLSIDVSIIDNGFTFLWSDGDHSSFRSLAAGNNYSVVVNNEGCVATDQITLNELSTDDMMLISKGELCIDYHSFPTYYVSSSVNSIWYPENSTSPEWLPSTSGKYWVVAENKNGCEVTDTFEVQNNCPQLIFIPSSFTPNNDGINDVLTGYLNSESEGSFSIFNRNGSQLYYSEVNTISWNGLFENKPCPSGIYGYLIQIKDASGKEISRTGTIALIR
ncbi:MAG: T9SS type B sorting domain-containing protein [Bacteroidota bacterium]